MPPYLPFLEAFGQHIRTAMPEDLRAQVGPLAGILATILPELALYVRDVSGYSLPPEQARLRLYEGIGAFVAAIAASQPLLLILDDLHWADPATLDLLCHIARRQIAAPLLVLGAHRSGEATHEPPFARAVAELNRLRVLTTVRVDSLGAADIAAMAERLLGCPTTG